MLEFLNDAGKLKERISKEKGISGKKLESLVRQKQEQFSGLLGEEAAVFSVAKELGMEVDVTPPPAIFTKISELAEGAAGVSVRGKVERIYSLKSFERDGRKGSMVALVLDDGSSSVRVVLWDLDAVKVEEGALGKGDEAEVLNAFVKPGLGGLEIQLGMTGSLKRVETERKHLLSSVGALEEGKEFDVAARVLEVGKRSEFERNAKKSAVGWCVIGDATGTVRLVLWDSLADLVGRMKPNDVVKVESGLARAGMGGELELHAAWNGRVLLNPKGVEVAGIAQATAPLKRISELVEGEKAEVRARIATVAVRDLPRFGEALLEDETGKVKAEFSGKAGLGLLGLKWLADDISLSTVLKLKGKKLKGKECYFTGKLADGKFSVESLVACIED